MSSGQLSPRKVASAFDLSVGELAALIRKKEHSRSTAQDAGSVQSALEPFEHVARLRLVLKGGDFVSWLRKANDELDGRTPRELILEGKIALVAELVEDMLTGSPS